MFVSVLECVCGGGVWVCTCHCMLVEIRGQLVELLLSFFRVSLGDKTQVRLGSNHLYLLSHLTGPQVECAALLLFSLSCILK